MASRGTDWHALAADAALAQLDSTESGLEATVAERRLAAGGPNRMPAARRRGPLLRLLVQFHNLFIYVLLAAAALAGLIGHLLDALVILGVVLINALIGFVQEGRAERALDAIRRMMDPRAVVRRGGRRQTIAVEALVPGDVVLLEAGDQVPADLRLLEASRMLVDEASLTGESVPVAKSTAAVAADTVLAERACMAFSGTLVASGQGAGLVIATGSATELGRISGMLREVVSLKTPLLRQMDRFARLLTGFVLALAVLMFGYAVWLAAYPPDEAFMVVVGLAVAAIPEGLPAVMTIALAVGVRRMAGRHAIIRRLPAVETLGAVSVICTDKTGTLTRNEMMVRSVATGEGDFEVEGSGYEPRGGFVAGGSPVDPPSEPVLEELCLAALLCNDAELIESSAGDWSVEGDPMEGALAVLGIKAGHDVAAARQRFRRLDVVPFDARHRYMATCHERPGHSPVVYLKGAPEQVLSMCRRAAAGDGEQPLDRDVWQRRVNALAGRGERVIALARSADGDHGRLDADALDGGLTLLGVVGLIDPPRPEALAAVAECRQAGVQVKMITGDHAATAAAIAALLGIAEHPEAVTGADLDALDADAFRRRALEASVFARTTPEHKLRLVEALQADGSVVAMTGDGVNDAPALKRADVGVAMGVKGTEAAKQAAEMVLGDDNFASIVAAVREGRTVYDNLTKVIAWTLPTNGGEAFTIVLALLFGLTLPVTPVQILWINMITAVTLGLTLAFEPTEPGAMARSPRPAGAPLLSGRLVWRVLFVSAVMVAGAFGSYAWALGRGLDVDTARTLVVNALVVMEIFYLFSVRYVHGTSLTWQGVLGTRPVLLAVSLVTAGQFAFTYLPALQAVFATRPLGVVEGLAVMVVGVALLVVVELEKRLARWVAPPA